MGLASFNNFIGLIGVSCAVKLITPRKIPILLKNTATSSSSVIDQVFLLHFTDFKMDWNSTLLWSLFCSLTIFSWLILVEAHPADEKNVRSSNYNPLAFSSNEVSALELYKLLVFSMKEVGSSYLLCPPLAVFYKSVTTRHETSTVVHHNISDCTIYG